MRLYCLEVPQRRLLRENDSDGDNASHLCGAFVAIQSHFPHTVVEVRDTQWEEAEYGFFFSTA